MCFRPGSVAKPIECPSCGKKLPVIGGVKQTKCPICKADLTQAPAEKAEEKTEQKHRKIKNSNLNQMCGFVA